MSYITKPTVRHPGLARNALGLTRRDYEGTLSTLCAGCGHDSVSAAIMQAAAELSIPPHRFAKLSGIGCSSKTPTYFLGRSHGFNSVHGRMPAVATGANVANQELIYIGISGDGDTASIGLGQFAHAVRRQLNMVYIVANNGTYGLTKGQFSATNDYGATNKRGRPNPFPAIDLCTLALELGASFVGRSFSGDKDQLVPLLKAALCHRGFAFLDVISPCVAFNNHEGSQKSYRYVREHNDPVVAADFVAPSEGVHTTSVPGETQALPMPDGSLLRLKRVAMDYDASDRNRALGYLREHQASGQVVTGLLYLDPAAKDLHEILGTVDRPLNGLGEAELCPGSRVLEEINQSLR